MTWINIGLACVCVYCLCVWLIEALRGWVDEDVPVPPPLPNGGGVDKAYAKGVELGQNPPLPKAPLSGCGYQVNPPWHLEGYTPTDHRGQNPLPHPQDKYMDNRSDPFEAPPVRPPDCHTPQRQWIAGYPYEIYIKEEDVPPPPLSEAIWTGYPLRMPPPHTATSADEEESDDSKA